MWWYRKQREGSGGAGDEAGGDAPSPLVAGLRSALADRPADLDRLLTMSLIVDSRIETADGAVHEGTTWGAAERLVEEAVGEGRSLKLYNDFARDFRDGYSLREDLPAEHRATLDALRTALESAEGIVGVDPCPTVLRADGQDDTAEDEDDTGELSVDDFLLGPVDDDSQPGTPAE